MTASTSDTAVKVMKNDWLRVPGTYTKEDVNIHKYYINGQQQRVKRKGWRT